MLLLVFFSLFPFLVLAFFDSSLLRSHFWPFTEVLRKIWPGVTRKSEGRRNLAKEMLPRDKRFKWRSGCVSSLIIGSGARRSERRSTSSGKFRGGAFRNLVK